MGARKTLNCDLSSSATQSVNAFPCADAAAAARWGAVVVVIVV